MVKTLIRLLSTGPAVCIRSVLHRYSGKMSEGLSIDDSDIGVLGEDS